MANVDTTPIVTMSGNDIPNGLSTCSDLQVFVKQILVVIDGLSPASVNQVLNAVRLCLQWDGILRTSAAAEHVEDAVIDAPKHLEPVL